MADSENSRTLSAITPGTLVPTAERFLTGKAAEEQREHADGGDPFLAKWNAWLAAHHEFARLCHLQQRLETQLLRRVASPEVELRAPGAKDPIIVKTEEEIEAFLKGETLAPARVSAKEELLVRRGNWNAADELVGYSRAKKAEAAASALEVKLADDLWDTPARSVVGVTAKVHAILKHGAPDPRTDEFPWPQIRSVLIDLLHNCGALSVNSLDP